MGAEKMKLVFLTALIAVCHTAKLDRTYLPPPSAATAGGNHDTLQTPLIKSSEPSDQPIPDTPLGSYTNEFQGVVVDAAAPGTRTSEGLTGLGAPRPSYGSTDSKVGDAAFRGSLNQALEAERPQANKDRNSNILTYSNEVNPEAYSYGFETDNGIAVGENGIAADGVQAQGGYSYQGDDGQTYKVTYVADEGGYRPQGAHLPTPPPIPPEILKSLEQNAKEEAAGVVDGGSYDAQKYNDNTHNTPDPTNNGGPSSQFGKRPEDTLSSSIINQHNQAFGKPAFGPQNHQAQQQDSSQYGHEDSLKLQSNIASGSNVQLGQFGHSSNSHAQFGVGTQLGATSGSQYGAASQSSNPIFGTQSQPGSYFSSQKFGQKRPDQPESYFDTQTHSSQPPSHQSGSQFGFQSNIQRPSHEEPSGQPKPYDAAPSYSHNQGTVAPPQGFGNPAQSGFSSQYTGQNINKPLNGFNRFPSGTTQINNFGPQNNFGTNNEYLPPINDASKPQRFETSQNSLIQNRPSQGFGSQGQVFQQNDSPASAASGFFGQQPIQSTKPNNFQNHPISNSNKFSGNFQTSQQSQILSKPSLTSETQFGSNLKPTNAPDTELTTPNESSPSSQSQHSAQTLAGFDNFNKQTTTQFVTHGNAGQYQNLSPSLSQNFNTHFQGAISKLQSNEGPTRPQFQQNSYNQNKISQTPGDSTHYQTSNLFNTPQGSRFPSQSYYPSNVGQNTQLGIPHTSRIPGTPVSFPLPSSLQFSQTQPISGSINGITEAAISPFNSVSPTPETQPGTQQNQFGSRPIGQNNQLGFKPIGHHSPPQLSSNPPKPLPLTPLNSEKPETSQNGLAASQTDSQQPAVPNQQYQGTIYQYDKPAQSLPAGQSDSDSSQTLQFNKASPKPNENQHPGTSQTGLKPSPLPQYGHNSYGQNKQPAFNQGIRPQNQQTSFNNRPQFISQSNSQFDDKTQFGSNIPEQQQFRQPMRPDGTSQSSFGVRPSPQQQFGSSVPTYYDATYQGYPLAQESRPQFGQNFGEISQSQNGFSQSFVSKTPKPNAQNQPLFGQNQLNQDSQIAPTNPTQQQEISPELEGQFKNMAILSPISPYQKELFKKPCCSQNLQIKPQLGNQPSHDTQLSNNQIQEPGQSQQFGSAAATQFQNVGHFSQPKPYQREPLRPHESSASAQASVSSDQSLVSVAKPLDQNNKLSNTQSNSDGSQPSQFGTQISGVQGGLQGVAGKGEQFGGPRLPPSFDEQTGYHY